MRNKRIPLIRQLVKDRVISTQEELVEALREHGIVATQATVSRDIKTLGLVKHPDERGVQRYFLAEEQLSNSSSPRKLINLLRDAMVFIETAQNMVVIRTLPGHAHAVASQFDGIGWQDLVATLAGDDTVLLIAKSSELALGLEQRVLALLE